MQRVIEFRKPIMDYTDMRYITEIIGQISDKFTQRKGDYVYNSSDVIEFTIEQIDAISEEYEVLITSSCIIIIN